MAYPIEVKEYAFQLFAKGYSYEQIASETGQKFNIPLGVRTVKRWARQYGWYARKMQILEAARKKIDNALADELSKLETEVAELRRRILAEAEPLQIRSKERALEIYLKLTDLLYKMQRDKGESPVDSIVETIFAVLLEHPRLGPLIDKYKEEIIQKIEERLQSGR